jgi:glycosidase
MVDRFHNGEPANDGAIDPGDPQAFHGGDLQGVTEKLDWLDQLGITTIWLSPVFEMRDEKFHGHGAFHGYWVEDFGQVEDRFGGEEALEGLSEAMAERQMDLMLDVVLNHVSFDAPLVTEKPHWFHGKGGITDWESREQILTHDVHGLPDLAQENQEVYDHLLGHSLHWIEEVEPSGFRLDAVKHVPNDFWVKFNSAIEARAGDDFVMLGEVLDGNPATVAETVREGDFNAIFDFPLHFAMIDVFCRDAHPGRLASILYADRQYPASVGARRQGLVTLLDNHDLPRVLSSCGNETERVVDALAFMLTARGTPSFTWGTESGATGSKEPDNRADMVFDLHPVGEAMKQWLALREEHPVLTAGKDRLLALNDDLFVYARTAEDSTALVAVNQGEAAPIALGPEADGITWKNLETGAETKAPKAVPGVTVWLASQPLRSVAPKKVPVEFRVKGAPEGEVRIVGSGPELGDWDPAKAPRGGAISLPLGGAFAFKVVVVGEDGTATWQSGENRFHLVDGSEPLTIRW